MYAAFFVEFILLCDGIGYCLLMEVENFGITKVFDISLILLEYRSILCFIAFLLECFYKSTTFDGLQALKMYKLASL